MKKLVLIILINLIVLIVSHKTVSAGTYTCKYQTSYGCLVDSNTCDPNTETLFDEKCGTTSQSECNGKTYTCDKRSNTSPAPTTGPTPITSAATPYPASSSAPTSNPQPAGATTPTTGTWYNQSFQEWYGKVYDPTNPSEIFGERYTAAQVQWIIYGLFGFLINSATGPQNSGLIQCFISNAANIDTCIGPMKLLITSNNVQSKTVAAANIQPKQNLLSLVFASNRPISGIGYFKQKIDSFSLVPVVHAQTVGFGFTMLEPIQEMWTGVRNIAYGLFVIASIVMAFMIMFRVKLSPQTVVSVQSALPKIILALILVTFSYAIAGFLIDLMYVVIGVISLALAPFLWFGNTVNVFNWLTMGQPFNINANWGVLLSFVIYLFGFILAGLLLLMGTLGALGTVLAGAGLVFVASLLGPLGMVIVVAILLILVVMILVMLFKILFGLLKAFANVILLTIFAPLEIVAGVIIPSLGFGKWLKSFVGALSVFVVTGVLMVLSFLFLEMGIKIGFEYYEPGLGTTISNALFGPGFGSAWTGTSNYSAVWPPLLGGGNSGPSLGLLFLAVSFVTFTLIPKANEIVQGFLSGRPFAYGTAVGEAVGGGYTWSGVQNRFEAAKKNFSEKPTGEAAGMSAELSERIIALKNRFARGGRGTGTA